MENFEFEHLGIKFNVEKLTNAVVDANGRPLWKITLNDGDHWNERAHSKETVVSMAKQAIKDNN